MASTANSAKLSKNQKRRAAKKAQKASEKAPPQSPQPEKDYTKPADAKSLTITARGTTPPSIDFTATLDETNPLFEQFKDILERFQEPGKQDASLKDPEKPEVFYDEDDNVPDEEDEQQSKMSKRQRKQQNKLSIAELKALVRKPEIVEWTDTDATEPRLLVALKSYRNVVPVPLHWSLKREYLSSKRGVEKAPFALPKYIQDTGIAEMRDAVLDKQNEASLKQKQRERVQPKMGKLDIDYQRLYEAFFRHQTKPDLSRYGEVYYEGKEYETSTKQYRPGELSEELKMALNMPPGAPPPWLLAQQRFGPPPAYPTLKIPGLNAPIPASGQWGMHPGGYGKPPLDEFSRPLYGGDVYGVMHQQQAPREADQLIEKTLWGELEVPQDEESEDEDEEDEEMDEDEDEAHNGTQTATGLETPGGFTSTAPVEVGGTESMSGDFVLRKQRGGDIEEVPHPRAAGTVLQEQNIRSSGFFGGEKVYDLKGGQDNRNLPVLGQEEASKKRKAGDLDVSVDVDALARDDRLSKDEIARQYEAQKKAEQSAKGWGGRGNQGDISQMIADDNRKRLKKDEERRNRR